MFMVGFLESNPYFLRVFLLEPHPAQKSIFNYEL